VVHISRRKSEYDHFRKLALEDSKYLYYINSRGYFERIDKSTLVSFQNTSDMVFEKIPICEKKTKRKNPELISHFNSRTYSIKHAVIRIIKNMDYDHDKYIIVHIDNNYKNCSADNLKLELKRNATKRYKIIASDKTIVCNSKQELLEKLGISMTQFRKYEQGKTSKKHWLNDITIERVL